MTPDARCRRGFRALLPFVAAASLVVGSVLSPAVAPAFAQTATTGPRPAVPSPDTLETERERNQSTLEALAADAEANRAALEALERDLAGMKDDQERMARDLDASAARRAELDRQIAESEVSLTSLNDRQDNLRASLKARRSVLAEVLAALQRIGRNPPPALLVTPDDALSSVRSAILLGAVVPEIRSETEALARDLEELAELRKAISTERQLLQQALADNQAESGRLEALSIEKLALRQEAERRLEAERLRAESLAERSAELEGLIASLQGEIGSLRAAADAARKAEEERKRRIAEQLERARKLAAVQLPDKNRIAPAYAFSALKGTLPQPAKGETVRFFGAEDGTGHGLTGEFLATDAGSAVRAPADGWIAYSGPFRSYGQTLILDAGEGYLLVLAGMDTIRVSEGQFVLAGEPVATMGAARGASPAALALAVDKPTLYIEIRKDEQPVDPREWWRDTTSSGRASNDS